MVRSCRAVVIAMAGAAGLLASGCGSGTTTGASPATSAASGTTLAASDYAIVPDATVTAGLTEVRSIVEQIKTTLPTDQAAAKALARQMNEKWVAFEGTVRKNDKVAYLQLEDGMAAIVSGVDTKAQDKVDKGVADVNAGAAAYLAKHP